MISYTAKPLEDRLLMRSLKQISLSSPTELITQIYSRMVWKK